MKFCLLVTVVLDIFIKEINNTLLSSLDFSFVIFLCKRCLLGQTMRRGTLLTIFQPPADIPNPPLIIFYTNFQPPCLLELPPPRLFRTLVAP